MCSDKNNTRAPLIKKEIMWSDWHRERPELIKRFERVLFFDPSELYSKIEHLIKPTHRHQGLGMDVLFPKIEKFCACGCGKLAVQSTEFKEDGVTPTWQRKWHSDECGAFAGDVLSIINNYFGKPAKYIDLYYGHKCVNCDSTHQLELDHIVGVKHGGGGCWLSNYEWKCAKCHREKTNSDFGFKQQNKNQLSIEINQQQPLP